MELVQKGSYDFRMKGPFCSRYSENYKCFYLKIKQTWVFQLIQLSWIEHDTNARVTGSIPVQAFHLSVGLDDPYGSLATQNIL